MYIYVYICIYIYIQVSSIGVLSYVYVSLLDILVSCVVNI